MNSNELETIFYGNFEIVRKDNGLVKMMSIDTQTNSKTEYEKLEALFKRDT